MIETPEGKRKKAKRLQENKPYKPASKPTYTVKKFRKHTVQ